MAGWFPPRGSEEGVVTDISFVLRNEVLQFDPDRIGALEFEYGPEATEDVLYSTTEQIVWELGPLQIAISSGDRTAVGEIATQIATLSDKVGLVTIWKVAMDVSHCSKFGNEAAFGATAARLVRVCEGCATGAFDFSDQYL